MPLSPLAHHFYTMACNNAWANHRLLAACSRLSQADFVAPRTSFFPSLMATLNHNLTVDWYYVDALERAMRGEPPNTEPGRFFDPETPFATCAELAAAQRAVDRRLIDACSALDRRQAHPAGAGDAPRGSPGRIRHTAARAPLPAPDPSSRAGARDARRHTGQAAAARRILLRERGPPARGGARRAGAFRGGDLGRRGPSVADEPAPCDARCGAMLWACLLLPSLPLDVFARAVSPADAANRSRWRPAGTRRASSARMPRRA